jgi:hypothetical protein
MKKSESFYETLRDNPSKIIEWCEAEIKEYRNLIKLVKKGVELKEEALNKIKKEKK